MTGTESSTGHIQGTAQDSAPHGILEVAVLDLRGRHAPAFEAALSEAMPLIRRQPGCHSAEVRPCLENPQRYLLVVNWVDVAAHEEGFRRSEDYRRWRALLHGFYEPFPLVEHYGPPL
jgi:quinol monooxygenase YgiN